MVVVGLQVREKSYGALLLGFRSVRSFDPQDLRVALAIGNQASVAIENWSLNRAAERRDEELRILHRVGESLRSTVDLNVQVEILRRELAGMLGGTNFGLALQDTPEGSLDVVVPFENPGAQDAAAGAPASSLAHYVQRTHSPLLVSSDVAETAGRLGLAPMNPRIRTWCGVPIHFPDGCVGVLGSGGFSA